MERHFELELDKLNKRILKMSALVSEQVHDSMNALITCDAELALQIIEKDKKVDKMDVKIDKLCQRIFALTQPVATDLRLIMSSLKMNNDLERMGDHAVGIAYKIESFADYKDIIDSFSLGELKENVDNIITGMNNILNTRDLKEVSNIFNLISGTEEVIHKISARILEEMMKKSDVIIVATTLMIILSQIERIAAYAGNICESVIFIVEGRLVKHKQLIDEEEEG
jgi:phosphate transport system protein